MGYDGTLKFDTSIATEGFQSGISKISSIAGKGLKATGAIIAGAGTAIVGLGTAAIKVGADFESGMSKVKAISNASGEEMAKLTEKAKLKRKEKKKRIHALPMSEAEQDKYDRITQALMGDGDLEGLL